MCRCLLKRDWKLGLNGQSAGLVTGVISLWNKATRELGSNIYASVVS